MTKPTAWMPIYVGDYLRDTGHLTTHQHGAYLLLIMTYWSSGRALPDDDLRLANITRIPPHLWKRTRSVLAPFFKIENGRWYHARIERELLKAYDNKDAAIARGKRGAAARWGDRASNGASTIPPMLGDSSSPSPIKNHESLTTNSTDAARDPARNGGSGPRASRTETSKERLARLAMESRQALLRKA